MAAEQNFRLRNPLLLMALAAAFPLTAYASGAASVQFASGQVTAVNASGVQRPLTRGAEIGNGDTVRTAEGRVQLRFTDGAMVSLQPQTDFRIDNYQYAGQTDGQEKGFFSLLKGGLRTITGLVGRVNRNNYKVSTQVATIGIRGTEYSATLDNDLIVSTGEGLVEVCNAAGCMLLAAGESGTVSGPNANPRRTDSRPQLSPAQPGEATAAVFSATETRNPDGTTNIEALTGTAAAAARMISGPDYAVAYAGHDVTYENPGYTVYGVAAPVNATFSPANELIDFDNGTATATTIAGAFSVDGVIGWGRWSSGNSSSGSLIDFHYVTGVPTPSADLTALGGVTATYNLIGYTLPTAQDGTVGQAPSGTLTASFGNASFNSSLSVNLTVPIGGQTFSVSGGTTFPSQSMPQTFSFYTGGSAAVNGFFAGANAAFAGIAYKIENFSEMGNITGTAAFKK